MTNTVLSPAEIASRMSELFKQNQWQQAQEELFADDCESIEPPHAPGLQTVKGLQAIKQKGEMFQSMIEEMHGGWVSEILVAGNYLTCAMGMEVTMKGVGRINMDEVCVYKVKDGKIISEQFFYD
jgi:ketosteroid isomerase-like protein